MQQIKFQGLACKRRRNTGSNYNLPRGLITRFQNFSDQIENGYSHHTNGVVFRRLFIAFFAFFPRNRFWSKGLKTVSNAWHSLAIKPDKMRERARGTGGWKKKEEKKTGRRTGEGQGNEQDRREQIFCPCFFSKKQRRSCLIIVRHEHVKKGHSLAL